MMMYIIIGIACLVGIIVVVLLLPNSGKQQQKGQKYRFELSAGGGRKITFADPFDNFLVYGGANSGKTKSIGKPLLSQYIQAGFAGFVYNYKDFDQYLARGRKKPPFVSKPNDSPRCIAAGRPKQKFLKPRDA